MPRTEITLGELHTAYMTVVRSAIAEKSKVANALDTTPTRAGNVLRTLEDAGLIASTDGPGEIGWVTRSLTEDEAHALFNEKFPGLTTIPKSTSSPKQGGTQMPNTKLQFEKSTTKTQSKKHEQVAKMIDILRKSSDPVVFVQDLCGPAGAKYPQDVEAAMFALEVLGLVEKYTVKDEGAKRPRVAYKFVGDAARPTKSTGTSSRKRSSSAKTKEEPQEAAATSQD